MLVMRINSDFDMTSKSRINSTQNTKNQNNKTTNETSFKWNLLQNADHLNSLLQTMPLELKMLICIGTAAIIAPIGYCAGLGIGKLISAFKGSS